MNLSEKEFLSLIEKHKGILLKVSRIYCDNPEDRKDLFQEIILQMWESISNFKQLSTFSTWMYRVAINTALVFHKKEKRKPDKLPIGGHDIQESSSYNSKADKQLQQFYAAVKHLNEIEKALIVLYLEGQSSEQMGETLGISAINARVKLFRTKTKIQKIIEDQNNEL